MNVENIGITYNTQVDIGIHTKKGVTRRMLISYQIITNYKV